MDRNIYITVNFLLLLNLVRSFRVYEGKYLRNAYKSLNCSSHGRHLVMNTQQKRKL